MCELSRSNTQTYGEQLRANWLRFPMTVSEFCYYVLNLFLMQCRFLRYQMQWIWLLLLFIVALLMIFCVIH